MDPALASKKKAENVPPLATEAAAGISPAQAYLLLYNSGCAVGWNLSLFKMGGAFIEGGGVEQAVEASYDVVIALQLLSTLEVVHACTGLVSDWTTREWHDFVLRLFLEPVGMFPFRHMLWFVVQSDWACSSRASMSHPQGEQRRKSDTLLPEALITADRPPFWQREMTEMISQTVLSRRVVYFSKIVVLKAGRGNFLTILFPLRRVDNCTGIHSIPSP